VPVLDSKRTNDEAAYRAFYQAHVRYVWKSLRRLGVAERDCEDLAQEIFVAVHRRWGERDESRSLKPWLFGFTFRIAIGHKRRSATRCEVPTDDEQLGDVRDSSRDVAKAMSARDAYLLVHAALEQLPMEQRAIVILHELDEVGAPEIARTLEVPLNTVYSRLRLGRERFRAALEDLAKGEAR
jgi:RNA polymerase sigma-70 factor, ECF subfamily